MEGWRDGGRGSEERGKRVERRGGRGRRERGRSRGREQCGGGDYLKP